jgi:hypothetical protein
MVDVLLLCFMPMFELYDHTRVAMGDKVKLAPLHDGRQNRPRLHHSGGLQDRNLEAPHLRTDSASTLHFNNVQLFSLEDLPVFYRGS